MDIEKSPECMLNPIRKATAQPENKMKITIVKWYEYFTAPILLPVIFLALAFRKLLREFADSSRIMTLHWSVSLIAFAITLTDPTGHAGRSIWGLYLIGAYISALAAWFLFWGPAAPERTDERLASHWMWRPDIESMEAILKASRIRAKLLPREQWEPQNPFGAPTPKFSGRDAKKAEKLFSTLSYLSAGSCPKIEWQLAAMASAIANGGRKDPQIYVEEVIAKHRHSS